MIKLDYKKSRDLSWKILIDNKVSSLPVNIIELCRSMNIIVKHYIPSDDNDGKSMIIHNTPVILVSSSCTIQRKRFTVAHELGHILLGHVGKYKLVNREPSPNDNPIEHEANIFASRLLAPACVLWGCNVQNADEISKLCGISRQAAEYRLERMQELYKRNKFLKSPLERQVYAQFKDFISNHLL